MLPYLSFPTFEWLRHKIRKSVQLISIKYKLMKQEEDFYRYLFEKHPTHPVLSNPKLMMVNVFENIEMFRAEQPDNEMRNWRKLFDERSNFLFVFFFGEIVII